MITAKAMHLPRSIGKEGVAGLCLIAENNGNHELLTVAASFSPCSLTQTQEEKNICSKNPWHSDLRFKTKTHPAGSESRGCNGLCLHLQG